MSLTIYGLRDSAGVEVFRGTIDPPPGGGSQPVTVSAVDPGAVGAGNVWVDTSGDPPVLNVRNSQDDGWLGFPRTLAEVLGIGDDAEGNDLANIASIDGIEDVRYPAGGTVLTFDDTESLLTVQGNGFIVDCSSKISGDVGFYGTEPQSKPTGVAVTAEALHAALVTLGLIAGP